MPFVVVIGDREVAQTTLSVRARDGQWSLDEDAAIRDPVARCDHTR